MEEIKLKYGETFPYNFTGIVSYQHSKCWYKNGLYHREDGPAVYVFGVSKAWFLFGRRHRTDGPALEFESSESNKKLVNTYWFNGEPIKVSSTEEFIRLIKLKAFW